MPPPRLRDTTSAPIITVMTSSRRLRAMTRRSSRRPYHLDRRAMPAPLRGGELFLREERLDLRAVLGALLDDAFPACFVGLGPIGCRAGGIEGDHLNASFGLPLGVLGVLLAEDA